MPSSQPCKAAVRRGDLVRAASPTMPFAILRQRLEQGFPSRLPLPFRGTRNCVATPSALARHMESTKNPHRQAPGHGGAETVKHSVCSGREALNAPLLPGRSRLQMALGFDHAPPYQLTPCQTSHLAGLLRRRLGPTPSSAGVLG